MRRCNIVIGAIGIRHAGGGIQRHITSIGIHQTNRQVPDRIDNDIAVVCRSIRIECNGSTDIHCCGIANTADFSDQVNGPAHDICGAIISHTFNGIHGIDIHRAGTCTHKSKVDVAAGNRHQINLVVVECAYVCCNQVCICDLRVNRAIRCIEIG